MAAFSRDVRHCCAKFHRLSGQMPDIKALVNYGMIERLGFNSLWVWDHILLGVNPIFPDHGILDVALTAIAARTGGQARHRRPGAADAQPRHPRQAACVHENLSDGRLLMGMARRYRREFNAIGVPFESSAATSVDENLDVLKRSGPSTR